MFQLFIITFAQEIKTFLDFILFKSLLSQQVLKKTQSGYADYGWNGLACIDKVIQTTIDTTTSACDSAITVNSFISDCNDLPSTRKRCGTTKVLSSFNILACFIYLSGTTCFLNNAGDGCTSQTACTSFIASESCIDGLKLEVEIVIGVACFDKVSTNIALTSHTNCKNANKSCTTNSAKTQCQAFAACNTYTLAEQCVKNSSGQSVFGLVINTEIQIIQMLQLYCYFKSQIKLYTMFSIIIQLYYTHIHLNY